MIKTCIKLYSTVNVIISNANIEFIHIADNPSCLPYEFERGHVTSNDYIYIESKEPIEYVEVKCSLFSELDGIGIYDKQKIVLNACEVNNMIFDGMKSDIDLHIDHSRVNCFIDKRNRATIFDRDTSQINYHIIDVPSKMCRYRRLDYMKINPFLYIIKHNDEYIPLELQKDHKFKNSPICDFAYLVV